MEQSPLNRRLSAIMAADVVGYSRLMAGDEAATLAALNRHREITFDPAVSQHGGRIVKLMGDGTLVEFSSVVDAVNCAIAIQQSTLTEPDDNIILRIGINLGDIILHGDDIYGDGVNIAARLEPLAKPGGICISSIVNESVANRTEVTFEDGGEVRVKNIDRPLKVWHWHPGDASNSQGREISAPVASPPETKEIASIAVLPFDNMSGDAEQEYFSDGISEDIITDLSKVSGLLVIARNSSFAYKGRNVDLRDVGRELGVTNILEGSVRKAGNRVRITAQLIDAGTGGHLWAERYDRDLTDIFAVQDEVTLEIVSALKIKLSPAEKAGITNQGTTNLEAHENYLRARSLIMSPDLTRDVYLGAVSFAEQAVELDPDYALAHSILALGYFFDYIHHWSGNDPAQVLAKAVELAARGEKLGPNESDAHMVVSMVAWPQKDLKVALSAIGKSLSLNPNNALALMHRGGIAVFAGGPEEGIPDLERAIRLDPATRHAVLQALGIAHLVLGRFETAALMFQERLQLARDTDVGRAMLAATLGHLGNVAQARQVWQDLMKINPNYSLETHLARLYFPGYSDGGVIAEGLAKAGLPI